MAIRYTTSQVNKQIDKITEWLMRMGLLKEEQRGQMEYLKEQMGGYRGLEELEQKGKMEYLGEQTRGYRELETQKQLGEFQQAQEERFTKILMLPPIQQARAEILQKQREGVSDEELLPLIKRYDDLKMNFAEVLDVAQTNKPWTSETSRKASEVLYEPGIDNLLKERAVTERQREEQAFQIKEVLPVRREEVAVRKEEVGVEREKPKQAKFTSLTKFVEDIEGYLIGEGVQEEITLADKKAPSSALASLFSDPKHRDPLTRELRGTALEYLGRIRLQLIGGTPLTPQQEEFLINVRNSYKVLKPIEEGGGLVSPETGMLPGAEAEVKGAADEILQQKLLEFATNLYKSFGLNDEQAAWRAKKILTMLR